MRPSGVATVYRLRFVPRRRKPGHTEHGTAILTLGEKLDGLRYCIERGHDEDALGHLFDLLHPAPLKEKACESE